MSISVNLFLGGLLQFIAIVLYLCLTEKDRKRGQKPVFIEALLEGAKAPLENGF